MIAHILRLSGADAYDLISVEHLSTLSTLDHETMHRAIMNSSRVWLGDVDDKIVAIWGLIPPTLLSDVAYLWLYTTKHFTAHQFMFIRHSQRAVQGMLEEYPRIVGHGMVGERRSLRWLRWLGAEFGEPIGNFLPFEIKAKSQWQQDSAQSA